MGDEIVTIDDVLHAPIVNQTDAFLAVHLMLKVVIVADRQLIMFNISTVRYTVGRVQLFKSLSLICDRAAQGKKEMENSSWKTFIPLLIR